MGVTPRPLSPHSSLLQSCCALPDLLAGDRTHQHPAPARLRRIPQSRRKWRTEVRRHGEPPVPAGGSGRGRPGRCAGGDGRWRDLPWKSVPLPSEQRAAPLLPPSHAPRNGGTNEDGDWRRRHSPRPHVQPPARHVSRPAANGNAARPGPSRAGAAAGRARPAPGGPGAAAVPISLRAPFPSVGVILNGTRASAGIKKKKNSYIVLNRLCDRKAKRNKINPPDNSNLRTTSFFPLFFVVLDLLEIS